MGDLVRSGWFKPSGLKVKEKMDYGTSYDKKYGVRED